MKPLNTTGKSCIAVITNHDDDLFCLRLELVRALLDEGYSLLVSCPDGPKLDLMKRQYGLRRGCDFLYDNPEIDRRGTNPVRDWKARVRMWAAEAEDQKKHLPRRQSRCGESRKVP